MNKDKIVIHDYSTSKPKMYNKAFVFVWEVVQFEEDGDSDIPTIKAVFFDPWKAVHYAVTNYGIFGEVKLSMYRMKECVPMLQIVN